MYLKLAEIYAEKVNYPETRKCVLLRMFYEDLHIKFIHSKWEHGQSLRKYLGTSGTAPITKKLKQCDFIKAVANALVLKFGFCFLALAFGASEIYK